MYLVLITNRRLKDGARRQAALPQMWRRDDVLRRVATVEFSRAFLTHGSRQRMSPRRVSDA